MPDVSYRHKLSSVVLIIAGIFFVLYPVIRPFSDEVSLEGAAAFASPEWLLAHMLAMIAFTFLALGFYGISGILRETEQDGLGYRGFVLSLIGIGLTLPFYGGEAFGLHAVGNEALTQRSDALLSMASVVRSGPGLVMFLIGLLLIGGSGIVVATALWKSQRYSRWSGVPLAIGLAHYIPQFFGNQPLRIVHGLLVTISCFWVAIQLWHHNPESKPSG